METRSPSQICYDDHIQNCHFCDATSCHDNTSDAAKTINGLRKALAAASLETNDRQQQNATNAIINASRLKRIFEACGYDIKPIEDFAKQTDDCIALIKNFRSNTDELHRCNDAQRDFIHEIANIVGHPQSLVILDQLKETIRHRMSESNSPFDPGKMKLGEMEQLFSYLEGRGFIIDIKRNIGE